MWVRRSYIVEDFIDGVQVVSLDLHVDVGRLDQTVENDAVVSRLGRRVDGLAITPHSPWMVVQEVDSETNVRNFGYFNS